MKPTFVVEAFLENGFKLSCGAVFTLQELADPNAKEIVTKRVKQVAEIIVSAYLKRREGK